MPVDTILKKLDKSRWADEEIRTLVEMGACVFHCGGRPDILTLPGLAPWRKEEITLALGHSNFLYSTKEA